MFPLDSTVDVEATIVTLPSDRYFSDSKQNSPNPCKHLSGMSFLVWWDVTKSSGGLPNPHCLVKSTSLSCLSAAPYSQSC